MKAFDPHPKKHILSHVLGLLWTLGLLIHAQAQQPDHGLKFSHPFFWETNGDRILFLGDSITQDGR